jgi:GNAT superfamily N-acetyltransferase
MLAHVAHADAAEVEGRLREPIGGGVARLRGLRAMSSGLPAPQWNSADVTAADADLDAAREFYGPLPWGLRVPIDMPWSTGRWLLRQPLMALRAGDLRTAAAVPGLELREADDLDAVLAVDGAAFGSDPEASRPWAAPHMGAAGITVALAYLGTEPVATAYSIRSAGEAGPALLLAGVGVVPAARGRGIAAALSAWLLRRGFATGARFAHLHADNDEAARIYARLGFAGAGALDIYADL